MIVTYLGKEFFKIQQGETILALNPISKDAKTEAKPSRFGSHIALSTTNHPDYNGLEMVSYGSDTPVTISGPGDYEVKEIFIKGAMTRTTLSGKEYISTMYAIEFEGIKIAFLGPLSTMPKTEEREGIESPDILFVSFGGELLDPGQAYKLAVSLEPGVIIPMDCDEKSLKAFLKEAGEEKVEAIDKLVMKKKDFADKEGEVMILKYE